MKPAPVEEETADVHHQEASLAADDAAWRGAASRCPLLDAMVPAQTALAKTAAAPQAALAFVYFPHGAIMDRWTPRRQAAISTCRRSSRRCEVAQQDDHRQRACTTRQAKARRPTPSPPAPGWAACAAQKPQSLWRRHRRSDRRAEDRPGHDFPVARSSTDREDGGNGCATATMAAAMARRFPSARPASLCRWRTIPASCSIRLFGVGDTAEERAHRAPTSTPACSISSPTKRKALQRTLGPQDRAMVERLSESVREIERQVQKMEEQDLSTLKLPDVPAGVLPRFRRAAHPDVRHSGAGLPGQPDPRRST